MQFLTRKHEIVGLQKYMSRKKTTEELESTYVECLLYAFHELAHKVQIQFFVWLRALEKHSV